MKPLVAIIVIKKAPLSYRKKFSFRFSELVAMNVPGLDIAALNVGILRNGFISMNGKLSIYVTLNSSQSKFFRKAPTTLVLALRILFRRKELEGDNLDQRRPVKIAWGEGSEQVKVETEHAFGGDYKSVYSLLSHIEEFPPVALLENIFHALIAKKCLKGTFEVYVERLVHHLSQIRTNVYGTFEVITEENNGRTQNVNQVKISEAIYPSCSLLNHSCVPNTTLHYNGRVLTVR
jgi:hypothetical protein